MTEAGILSPRPRAPMTFVRRRARRSRWTIWHSIAAWAGFWFAIGVYLWVAL